MSAEMNRPIQVHLLDHHSLPLETLYCLWQASRHNEPLPSPQTIALRRQEPRSPADEKLDQEVRDLFLKIIDAQIPVAENISFTFVLENVPISLREQLVRHRIGVHVGDRLGADMVPDLADSTWWSQSMRILDMGQFATDQNFHIPESIFQHPTGHDTYQRFMRDVQRVYRFLTEQCGVPMEDARQVIPLAATHRLSWTLNLAALLHIVGKRSCWILQLGLWKPVIEGMVRELADNVDPLFQNLLNPPCMNRKGEWKGCCYKIDNERRVAGEDAIPPCPLYLLNHEEEARQASPWKVAGQIEPKGWGLAGGNWENADESAVNRFYRMVAEYEAFWGRDAWTGEEAKVEL